MISGKKVPPPSDNEDSFQVAETIIKDLTGYDLEKSQVRGSCNY